MARHQYLGSWKSYDALHDKASPQCLLSVQTKPSPQAVALKAAAHLRTPPPTAKKALRFLGTPKASTLTHEQSSDMRIAAAHDTSKGLLRIGRMAAAATQGLSQGFSSFFGAPAAGRKTAGATGPDRVSAGQGRLCNTLLFSEFHCLCVEPA